jgi:hypothetical protein
MARTPVNILKNTWTLVAENVTNGVIELRDWYPSKIWCTYVVHGDPAPTLGNNTRTPNLEPTAVKIRQEDVHISSTDNIDVYLFCVESDAEVVVSL